MSEQANVFNGKEKIIIAHRGASAYEKENTLRSFERAIAMGADMIEFDVRKTADQVLIAHHNEAIQGKGIGTLSYEAVERCAARRGFHVPTLEEVLILARGKIGLNAELKEEGYEKDVILAMRVHLDDSNFILTSFNATSLDAIRSFFPNLKTGLILGRNIHRSIDRVETDFWIPNWRLLDDALFRMAERSAKPLIVWTVNDRRKLKKYLSDPRIHGVITDRPDLAGSARRELLSAEAL
ncbi:MAG TPA: glycerophosphodiester phosphodiesterase [Syntrophales bacterium]|nr:glycerophosphodiester phosphodiesterase [Syntrophales bacterium]HPI57291.1 glycerophosphodiester phosphodiesterase [Syntrophales bacterium]HPN25171.1 glycerophosphodiester phosphodiesterase [Syntrophales bacterium]